MPGGRPSKYTPELALKICKAVSISTDSLKKICDAHEDFPCKDTVNEWRFDYPEFSALYAEAKRVQAELLAEEIQEIADDEWRDEIETEKGWVPNTARVARHRLRVDTRKWIACKLLPKVYGDKTTTESVVTIKVHEDLLKELE